MFFTQTRTHNTYKQPLDNDYSCGNLFIFIQLNVSNGYIFLHNSILQHIYLFAMIPQELSHGVGTEFTVTELNGECYKLSH